MRKVNNGAARKGVKYVQSWQKGHQSDVNNVFIANLEHILRLFLVFLLLPLNI